jgi:hypothetical protein
MSGAPRDQGGEVQADRPPLGPFNEVAEFGSTELHACTLEKKPRLPLVRRELVDPDLDNLASRTQQCRGEWRLAAGGDDQLRSRG